MGSESKFFSRTDELSQTKRLPNCPSRRDQTLLKPGVLKVRLVGSAPPSPKYTGTGGRENIAFRCQTHPGGHDPESLSSRYSRIRSSTTNLI